MMKQVKLGDAMRELYFNDDYSWYDNVFYMPFSVYPWLGRGGRYDIYSGLFVVAGNYGYVTGTF